MRASTVRSQFLDRCGDSFGVGGTYGFMPMLDVTSARFHSTKLFRIFAKVTRLLRMSMPSDAAANWMPLSRGTSRPLYPTIGAPLPRRTSVPMPRSVSLPSHRRLPLIDHASSSVTSAAALANERWQAQT